MLSIAIAEAAVLVLLCVLVVGLLRSHADILRRLHDLGEGLEDESTAARREPATGGSATGGPAFNLSGISLGGEAVEIGLVGAPDDTVLAFLSATCYTCEPFWAALAAGATAPGGARLIVVVQDGDSLPSLRRLAGDHLLVLRSDAAWMDYQVPGSPHFVYVAGPAGRVTGEGTASTWAQIGDLLEQAHGATQPDVAPRDNAQRIDLELLSAGIGQGHRSLYPDHVDAPADPAPR